MSTPDTAAYGNAFEDAMDAVRYVIDSRDNRVTEKAKARLRQSLGLLEQLAVGNDATSRRVVELHDAIEKAVSHLDTAYQYDDITADVDNDDRAEHNRHAAECARHAHEVLSEVV